MTTLYEKRGRRYIPVANTRAIDGLSNGSWLVVVDSGMTTIRQLVNPDHAGFLAAASVAERAMVEAVRKASDAVPQSRTSAKLTRAWKAYKAIAGDETMWLNSSSTYDIVQAGIQVVLAKHQEKS